MTTALFTMKQVSFIFWRRLFINSGSDCIVNHPLLTNFVFPIQSKTDYTHNLIFSNYFSFSIFFFTSPTFHFISMEFEPTITSLLQYLLTVINSERTTRIDLQTRFSILQEDFHYLERRHVELEECNHKLRLQNEEIIQRLELLERKWPVFEN